MSPTFILASSSSTSALPSSPALNLLPFSLGPSSKPHTSTSAPLSAYFRPRPAPPNTPGIPTGTPIAAFRGRQLAGQSVPVPRGYRGVVIAADRPDVVKYSSGQVEPEPQGKGKARKGKWPLTPAASDASVTGGTSASTGVVGQAGPDEGDGTEMRRSTRSSGFDRLKQKVKGAGQVALARPKRGAVKTGTKRYRLDSDDEDGPEDGGSDASAGQIDEAIADSHSEEVTAVPPLSYATPSKRARSSVLTTPTRQSPRLAQPRTPAPLSSRKPHLPVIALIQATPLKEPLPPPPPHLRRKKNKADYVIPGAPGAETAEAVAAVRDEGEPSEAESSVSSAGEGSEDEGIKEEMEETTTIPSPATENDPPTFPIPSPAPSVETPKEEDIKPPVTQAIERDISSSLDISGPIRVLRPIATFDAITLWTPDAPLAGYKDPVSTAKGGEELKGEETTVPGGDVEPAIKEEEGPTVRLGWWAPGGSGEGGDEVVRAMGEWLGLVGMLNEPVYLDQIKDEDEDEEDEV